MSFIAGLDRIFRLHDVLKAGMMVGDEVNRVIIMAEMAVV